MNPADRDSADRDAATRDAVAVAEWSTRRAAIAARPRNPAMTRRQLAASLTRSFVHHVQDQGVGPTVRFTAAYVVARIGGRR